MHRYVVEFCAKGYFTTDCGFREGQLSHQPHQRHRRPLSRPAPQLGPPALVHRLAAGQRHLRRSAPLPPSSLFRFPSQHRVASLLLASSLLDPPPPPRTSPFTGPRCPHPQLASFTILLLTGCT